MRAHAIARRVLGSGPHSVAPPVPLLYLCTALRVATAAFVPQSRRQKTLHAAQRAGKQADACMSRDTDLTDELASVEEN